MAATRSAGVRRLMREAAELSQPTDMYVARPLEVSCASQPIRYDNFN